MRSLLSRPGESTDALCLRGPPDHPRVRHRAAIAGSPQESFRSRSIGGLVSSSSRVRGHATHRLPGPSEPWATGAVLWPAFATAPSTARAHLVRVQQIVQTREQPIRPPADAQPAFLAASDGVDAPDDRLDRRAAGASGAARDRRRARRRDSRVCAETVQVPAVACPQRRPRAGALLPGARRGAGARGAPTNARANATRASIGGTPARAAEPRVHRSATASRAPWPPLGMTIAGIVPVGIIPPNWRPTLFRARAGKAFLHSRSGDVRPLPRRPR